MKKILQVVSEKIKGIDFLMVSASTVIASMISFLFSVMARRYIPPLEYGIYSTCLLLSTYMSYAQLGVLNAFNRDYPQLVGAKNTEKSKLLKNTTFSFFLASYILVGIVVFIIISILFLREKMELKYYVGYIFTIILLIIENIASFSMNIVRMNGEFNYTSLINIVKSIISVVIGLIAIHQFGYYGIYVMPASCAIVSICFYYRRSISNIKLKVNSEILKESIRTGFPMMISNFVWAIVASVDKFVILGFMTTEDLGIYSIAQIGFNMVVLIPQAMGQVFYIKMSTAYGQSQNRKELIKQCNENSMLNVMCASLVSILVYYLLPVLVQLIMPQYMDGVQATQILLIGVAIYSSTFLYDSIYSVLRWNKELISDSIALCIFNIFFSVLLVIICGRRIENVAMGTSVSYAAFSLLKMVRISRRCTVKIVDILKRCWFPIGIVIIPAVVLYETLDSIYLAFGITIIILVLEVFYYLYKRKRELYNV